MTLSVGGPWGSSFFWASLPATAALAKGKSLALTGKYFCSRGSWLQCERAKE